MKRLGDNAMLDHSAPMRAARRRPVAGSDNFDAEALAGAIEAELRTEANPQRGAGQRADYRDAVDEAIGCGVPHTRRTARRFHAAHRGLAHDDVIALVEALWAPSVLERRGCAIELLVLYRALLDAQDAALVERMLRQAGTWALVDGLATGVMGPLVERFPELLGTLDRWAQDPDFWMRRSALLALLPALRRDEGAFERFARYADAMLEEKEFFVRKAIGWVLR